MAKPSHSVSYRKVDVDSIETYNPDDDAMLTDESVTGPSEGEVSNLLNRKANAEALKYVLQNAPVTSKDKNVKKQAFDLCLRVLLSFKSSEIDEAVKSLDQPEVDMLMKYIYRGFDNADGANAQLLTWHEKTFSVGGSGSIVRVLTDRKQV
ncbi:hypothetical protein CAPTEDRAFT_17923 [Capitella teleta]|uniref:Actin-related protein 2/3 complex subunit 5 n=1 Tax=Capitella teleta TaxID=283909 RepID=X1ZF49_CAPTE|nr:hypothetical protein CAPTEDRAFT_17923 [Capitella teleta]|eukprot:ELU10172.1 hypothetical protein CAPTEDRAFT_17923 [Capitella teleta]